MRAWLLLIIGSTACRFNPTIEDISLVGCNDDADCPRAASCIGGVCVSNPLSVEVTATPANVEAGDSCIFEARAIHSLGANRLQYHWAQVLGPRVPLAIDGNRVELVTTVDDVASYALEVVVTNGVEPAQRGRAACVALRTDDAAFVVQGHNGDCSRDNPCTDLDTAEATGARTIYLGVNEGTTNVVNFAESIDERFDDREVHGGFVYPGWRRDPSARTDLAEATAAASIYCDRCAVSGIYHLRLFTLGFSEYYAVSLSGDQMTVRELEVEMGGGGGALTAIGIHVHQDSSGVNIEGAQVHVHPTGLTGTRAIAIDHPGTNATIRDSVFDLRGATAGEQTGVSIYALATNDSRPWLDRVMVRTGNPIDLAIGMDLDCTAARVTNSMVIADTLGDSQALRLDGPAVCPSGTVIHSSLFIAGSGPRSTAVRVVDGLRSLTLTNSILDAGDGFERRVFDIASRALEPTWIYDFQGTVLILEGGVHNRDAWGGYDGSARDIGELEALFSCPGCFASANTAAHVDRTGGDFHLTADSSCCIDTGEPIGEQGPHLDYDGVPRPLPPARPAIGPYQRVP